jgi:protein-S-isoprenylcysteine O-methyltransferase Ste14
MSKFPDLPPLWTIAAILLIFLINRLAPVLPLEISNLFASYLFGIVGIIIAVWAAYSFFKYKTTIEPGETPSTLLTTGPFRLTRNPIYLGMVLVTLAAAARWGHVFGYPVVIILYIVLDRRFARPEEKTLIETFGDKAQDYIASVRRW